MPTQNRRQALAGLFVMAPLDRTTATGPKPTGVSLGNLSSFDP
jgi:hypothetical protein